MKLTYTNIKKETRTIDINSNKNYLVDYSYNDHLPEANIIEGKELIELIKINNKLININDKYLLIISIEEYK